VGPGHPIFLVAEMSANHNQQFDRAVETIRAAAEAGADAIKLQTYTADTMTIRSDKDHFRIAGGTLWDGRTLYELYEEAHTPWEWQLRLKAIAEELGMLFFSTAFDPSAVDFLEEMGVPVHKIASFELVDIPLIEYMARARKPMILSTGMATQDEIAEAVQVARSSGATQIALLKCTSAYPAPPEDSNLLTIPHMSETFSVPVGLSDHTLGTAVPVAAVALGACIVEKHFTLSRTRKGPDAAFSLEPHEFAAMVEAIRTTERALGGVHYARADSEEPSRAFRRSLFVVKPIKRGETFTRDNVRSIRPGSGLHTRYVDKVVGRKSACDLAAGTPLSWEYVRDVQ